MIIAISGKAGSGKSTVGEIFEKRGFRIDSFATSVKDICSLLFNFSRDKIEGIREEDRIWRETPDKSISELLGKNFSPRDAMILIGTEIGRNIIHQDIWIKTLFDRYEKNKTNLLISDLRFPNEYEEIKKRNGIIIRINSNRLTNSIKSSHISECALDNHKFDYIINNDGSLDELYEQVNNVINNKLK
jgi:hypothetical protein